MSRLVKSIQASGIYGRFDLTQTFGPGVNVLYGRNGTGKTTLLHILANILNADYARFAFLPFESISLELDDKTIVSLRREGDQENGEIVVDVDCKETEQIQIGKIQQLERATLVGRRREESESGSLPKFEPHLPSAYFPAFRTMIEAWSSRFDDPKSRFRRYGADADWVTRGRYPTRALGAEATMAARGLFGRFVPEVNYPSPTEIEGRLVAEAREAFIKVGSVERQIFSRTFRDVFAAVSSGSSVTAEPSSIILKQIEELLINLEGYPLVPRGASAESVYQELLRSVKSLNRMSMGRRRDSSHPS